MTDIQTTAPAPYQARAMHASLAQEIARLREQVWWTWDKEVRNLAWFGLRDGMSILEVGSGPGFITEQLLMQCPTSHVTCVELDRDLIGPAEDYLQSCNLTGRYTIVPGDLLQMALPDSTFDFVFARFVFQHLRDPHGALAAIHRVLKPGGTLVIHDIDVGLGEIYEPQDAAAAAIEEMLHEGRAQRGGDPRIGRKLWRLLVTTGYTQLDLEVVAAHTDRLGTASLFPANWDPGSYKAALDSGILTAKDLEILHQAHIATQTAPDKYALFVSLMVRGQKAL